MTGKEVDAMRDLERLLPLIEGLMVHITQYHREREASEWAEKIGLTLLKLNQKKIDAKKAYNILHRVSVLAERYDFQENADMAR